MARASPTEMLTNKFPRKYSSGQNMRRNLNMFGRRNLQTARLGFSNIRKPTKIAHIITGHHLCKTPPADIMLLETLLLVNRIYQSHTF